MNVRLLLGEREPIQVADLREEVTSDINEITLRAGYRARLLAPLSRGEDMVGMLVIRRKTPGAFPQNTVDLIKTFAAQSALAIENARLFENVEASLEDLRTAQDRLVQTEKLASLGQLTAGIAHEGGRQGGGGRRRTRNGNIANWRQTRRLSRRSTLALIRRSGTGDRRRKHCLLCRNHAQSRET